MLDAPWRRFAAPVCANPQKFHCLTVPCVARSADDSGEHKGYRSVTVGYGAG